MNKKCFCLYVNLTSNYISFKIEEGKNLGKLKENPSIMASKNYFVIEHKDDEVNYLQKEDIFKTEEEAYKGLIKILQDKIKIK